MSELEVAEVPPAVVTVASTVPAGWAGLVATQVVVAEHVTVVAAVSPNRTEVVADPVMKPVPVMVTPVPPLTGPAAGVMAVTVGMAA